MAVQGPKKHVVFTALILHMCTHVLLLSVLLFVYVLVQLNFPRLRQRRWRLLSRWLLLAVLTAIAMSFMQVGREVGLRGLVGVEGCAVMVKGRVVRCVCSTCPICVTHHLHTMHCGYASSHLNTICMS